MKSVRFGIIGGGQLAMMLADAGKALGCPVSVLAETEGEPATSHADRTFVGSFTRAESFQKLFDHSDVIAFESEFSNGPVLREVSCNYPQIKGFHLDAMDLVADKLCQKRILKENSLPTADYIEFSDSTETWLKRLAKRFPEGSVIKWARGGYDGRGNFVFRNDPSQIQSAMSFIEKGLERKIAIYAEELIPFNQELAALTARSEDGTCQSYPTLITTQKDGICVEATGPGVSFGLSGAVSETAQNIAQTIGRLVGLSGVYAVEFFLTQDGRVLVNEIAPRVHNSGHFTLGAAVPSQFTSHWLSLLGESLPPFKTAPFFGMLNVLGPAGVTAQVEPCVVDLEGVHSYWYEKSQSRPNRKMGHITIEANTREIFISRMEKARHLLGEWHSSQKNKYKNEHTRSID